MRLSRMTFDKRCSSDPASVASVPTVAHRGTAEKLTVRAKAAYAFGGATDTFGHWLYGGLSNQVFVTFLHLSPSQTSIALFTARLVDAFTDPLFGWISDNTRSKWGRRRPYILFGSLAAGLALPCLFMASPDWDPSTLFWFMVISVSLYAPLNGVYNMPYQSLGAELTPDYDERTSVTAWRAVVQTLAAMLVNWAWWFASRPLFNDPITGQPNVARGAMWAATIAGGIMILAGLANFRWTRERYYERARAQEKIRFVATIRQTLGCRPFLALLGVALLFAVPCVLFGNLGYYVLTYYVFGGDAVAAASMGGWLGVAYGISSLAGVPVAHAMAARLGKRDALVSVLLIGSVAVGSTYWLYTPASPWLCVVDGGLYGFASTSLWVILPSMCADTVDFDELATHHRREGAFSSVFSWAFKIGMAVSTLSVGPLLGMTGFDSGARTQAPATVEVIRLAFAAIPAAACLAAALAVSAFPLSRERMQAVRAALEARRGTV